MAPSIMQATKVNSQSAETTAAVRKSKTMISTAEMFKPAYKQKHAATRSKGALPKCAHARPTGVQKRANTSKKASSHPLSDAFNDASSDYADTVLREGLESLNIAHSELIDRLNETLGGEEDAAIKQLTYELTRPFDTESLTITENTLNGEKKMNVTLGGQMKDFAALIEREEESLTKLMKQHKRVTTELERLMSLCCEDDFNQDIVASLTCGWWQRAQNGEETHYPDGRPIEPPNWYHSQRSTMNAAKSKLGEKLQKIETEIEQLGAEELAQMVQEEKESEVKKRTARRSLVESARHLL